MRQWPFQGKVSPALESSPTLGEGRTQRRLDPAPIFRRVLRCGGGRGRLPALLPVLIHPLTAFPAKPRLHRSAPRSSSQPRRALGGQPKQIGEFNSPHYQIHIDVYIEQTHVPSSELQKSQDQRVNKRLQQSVWHWWGLRSSWEGAGPALCRNLAVTRISCRKQSF